MRCTKAKKLISSYLDGELSKSERDVFESHIKQCEPCSKEFEALRDMHAMFARTERFNAPYGFSTRVMANLAGAQSKKRLFIPLFTKCGEALLIAVVVILGIASGDVLVKDIVPQNGQNVAAIFSLDAFDAASRDSVGGAYLAMMEGKNEK
jgi:anti-sigma factor RsiW